MNIVMIKGIISDDFDIRYTGKGDAVVNLTIKSSKSYRDSEGNAKTADTYHKVVFFGEKAKTVHDLAKKDTEIFVNGEINHRSYEKDGAKRWVTEIKAKEFEV